MQSVRIFASERARVSFGRAAERREVRRSKIFAPVTLSIADDAVRGHLLDIGTAGALCVSATMPMRGSIVDVGWLALHWAAEVVWVTNKRFGLRFLSPLNDDTVQNVLDHRAA